MYLPTIFISEIIKWNHLQATNYGSTQPKDRISRYMYKCTFITKSMSWVPPMLPVDNPLAKCVVNRQHHLPHFYTLLLLSIILLGRIPSFFYNVMPWMGRRCLGERGNRDDILYWLVEVSYSVNVWPLIEIYGVTL